MTKVDENMAQAKKMLETIVERNYELQKEVWEWRSECYILEEENKKLKEENEDLKQIIKLSKSYEEWKNKLKEVYIKNTAKFLDKKFPKINWFMEEDTLQELRDLGKI